MSAAPVARIYSRRFEFDATLGDLNAAQAATAIVADHLAQGPREMDPKVVGALLESLENVRRHSDGLARFYHHLPSAD